MEICSDSFAINLVGNLLCTFRLENRENVSATYGITPFRKAFLYSIGTGVDESHPNYGFHYVFDPAPGAPDFPAAGVTITGAFVDEDDNPATPDLTGTNVETKIAYFKGMLVVEQATYPGGNFTIVVLLSFNPGV